ncbi:putative SAM-dependent methyltransferase [Podospora fimiseda]|uniref:SAM-dependent methyltransferase n=1 Tax=Podospora fimiseda TaxID=252190 RepID=A0AAN7BZA2_9PEZI|nr:putative SAM-dependent methyltransferase [Podospora fimiseda]
MPHDYNPEYLRRYLKYWNRDESNLSVIDHEGVAWATEEQRKKRQKHYSIIAIYYYDFFTPFYEQEWGQRFHYTPQTPGLSLYDSFTKYEQTFAHISRFKEGIKVLDLGCGLAGPALTNNDWLVVRGTELNKQYGLDHKIKLQVAKFLNLPFPDNYFDAAYSIEALCYVPNQVDAYKESFDDKNNEYRRVRNLIEFGNGLSKMPTVKEIRQGIIDGEDMTFRSAPVPWYYGPGGHILSAWKVPGWKDFIKVAQMSEPFLFVARIVQRIMIFFMGIFAPLYVFSCRKPFEKGERRRVRFEL